MQQRLAGAVLARAERRLGRVVEEHPTGGVLLQRQDKAKPIAGCDRTILAEGTCEHLACNSSWACCDPAGTKCDGKTKSKSSSTCPTKSWTPMFTCDSNCEKAVAKGCDDNDNWMAIPRSTFTRAKCGDTYTVCTNGRATTGYVRDKSETASSYEVSPGIQTALGVAVNSSFKGAVYGPGKEKAAAKDPCCGG